MTFAIAPMTAEHVPEAAALFDRWPARTLRSRPYQARSGGAASEELVGRLLAEAGGEAVVARTGRGRLAGYLAVRPGGVVAHGGHAALAGQETEALRQMYAAVSERLVARGCLVHRVQLPADDALALAWFRLGFGLEEVRGVMPVKATGRQPRGVEGMTIRRAGPADLGPIGRMAADSAAYRQQAAMFQPQSAEALAERRTRYADALADPRSAAWLAVRRGEEAGMVVLVPDAGGLPAPEATVELAEAYVQPAARGAGINRVLLATALAWAYDRGYRQVAADWPAASPLAARHWPRVGFVPVAYRLCRVLDPRIVRASGAAASRVPGA